MEREEKRVFSDVMIDDLAQIRHYVRETAVALGCEQETMGEFIVAVNEAAANIVRHTYQDRPGEIVVTVSGSSELIRVVLQDKGPRFDPTRVPSPDTTLPLAERPFGGLGVHLMRSYCDELHYHRSPQGQNKLVMLKRLNK